MRALFRSRHEFVKGVLFNISSTLDRMRMNHHLRHPGLPEPGLSVSVSTKVLGQVVTDSLTLLLQSQCTCISYTWDPSASWR